MVKIKSNWIEIKRGIFSKPSGTINNIIVSKNGTIRLKSVTNINRRNKND